MDIGNEILVLDDDPVKRELVSLWLAGAGFDVYHPRSVMQGLRIRYPDTLRCIIADLDSARMETRNALHQLRACYPSALIIVITECAQPGAGRGIEQSEQFDMAYVLAKPFNCAQLVSAVKALLADAKAPLMAMHSQAPQSANAR